MVLKNTASLLRSNDRREFFPLKINNKTRISALITSTQYYTGEYSYKTMKKGHPKHNERLMTIFIFLRWTS